MDFRKCLDQDQLDLDDAEDNADDDFFEMYKQLGMRWLALKNYLLDHGDPTFSELPAQKD